MSEYRVLPRADRDLIEHFAYIAVDKLAPADRFLDCAERSFERLADFPGIGRAWESCRKRLKSVRVYPMPAPYRSYLIFYRVTADQIVDILAVLHAARDIQALVEEIL